MKRPIGFTALAILTFLAGVYHVYITLIWLGFVGFEFLGKSVKVGDANWGQATLAGIMALIYFAVAYGFWTMRAWSWIYGLLISGFNLFWMALAVLGPTLSLESVLVPILLNLLIFGYLYSPGTREVISESEGARMDAMMDASEGGNAPAPAAYAPPPTATPPAPPPSDTHAS